MRDPKELSQVELAHLMGRIQTVLWYDHEKGKIDPEKEWEVEFLDEITQILGECGLTPRG